ncbi:MAG: FAD-dependent oxidoreductase [Candidatus Sumerlaeia bacterium]|nr:FAD-dependent oxidoreductase [Candidatus Sumerlaeia bacterium]
MSKRILILGAGVCGLATAHRLLKSDPSLKVTLLEQEDRPGGLARSLTVKGQVSDLGPHRIFTELPDVKRFLQDLAGDQMETVKRSSKMWLRGRWIEYPPRIPEVLECLGLLNVGMAGVGWGLRKIAKALPGMPPEADSFEALMKDAFGPGLYDLLVGPYAKKVWKVPPSEIHGDIARVRVSAGGLDQVIKKLIGVERKDQITAVKEFFYLPGGVESLVHKLRSEVEDLGGEIQLVKEVRGIKEFRTGHLQVTAVNKQSGREEVHQAEQVVSTIPLDHLLGMLEDKKTDKTIVAARKELRYISNFLVCFVIDRPNVTSSQWLYFPGGDTIFNRGYEPKNFHPSMGTTNQAMMVLEVTAHPGDKYSQMSDRQLLNACFKGAVRTNLFHRDEVVGTLVHRIPYTYPLYDLKYRERLDRIWRWLEQYPNLLSAGRQGLFLHNNMDHSIHMGFRAAERLLGDSQNPAAAFYSEVRRFQSFRIVD